VRFILSAIFFRAGFSKLQDLEDFRTAIKNYSLVPAALVPVVALALPVAECVVSVMLAAGILISSVAVIMVLLLLSFSVAIAINLARGRVFDCGCNSAALDKVSWPHVARNMAFAILAAGLALAPPTATVIWAGPVGPFPVAVARADILPSALCTVLILVSYSIHQRANYAYAALRSTSK
jgi:uncharacterized membrane protein YphA (DoxX/SURF4 family)